MGAVGQGRLVFNGLDGSTGGYLLPPMSPAEVAALARGEAPDEARQAELRAVHGRATEGTLGPRAGIDPTDLAATGWAVLFARDADPAIREALGELLEHRRRQAGARHERYYRELSGEDGYLAGESHARFLARYGASPGRAADPDLLPYYVLIVGDPEAIPYSFQYQLDVMYATGRVCFERPEEYASYARSVVAAETGGVGLPRRAAFFGVANPDDPATQLAAEHLVGPLGRALAAEQPEWEVRTLVGEAATRARLGRLLGGDLTPAVLFTASHGLGFPNGDPRQAAHQGALVCQDWPGPSWGGPIPPEHYVVADDVGTDARLHGLFAFHFACYSAGTPRFESYAQRERRELAPRGFVAGLPRRLLGHPNGGALAVVGHVDRAWSYSFYWPEVGRQTQVFEDLFRQLFAGHPIGSALECFNLQYAALSTELSAELEEVRFGKRPDEAGLAALWTANNDARSFVILGDPAVRLPLGGP